MPEHTPGPWIVTDEHPNNPTIRRRGEYALASTYPQRGPDGIAAHDADANARLIAAAPDLLAACKGLLQFIKTFNVGGDWCQRNYPAVKAACAAIAKVKDREREASSRD